MDDIGFWANFFGQFKDLNDWVKALIIVTPFASITIIAKHLYFDHAVWL